MSDANLLFEKPVSVLAREVEGHDNYGPDAVIVIKVAQNGFKIRVMGENFVAKTTDEAKELLGQQLDKLLSKLKKNDKK